MKLYKKLQITIIRNWGRNNKGLITVRHKGGGYILKHDFIDEFQRMYNYPLYILQILKTNNSNYLIGLVINPLNIVSLIRINQGIKEGDIIFSGFTIPIKISNRLLLSQIPTGLEVSQLENIPGKGIELLKSAGTRGKILKIYKNKIIIKLMSGELKLLNKLCFVSYGQVSNSSFYLQKINKAGINYHKGIRPTVRGVAMNPIDHPHGGGEGKTSGGRCSVSPWGKLTKGKKTTNKRNKKINLLI